jgi:hypothetical protein
MLKPGSLLIMTILAAGCDVTPQAPQMSRDEALAIARNHLRRAGIADEEPSIAYEFDKIWLVEWSNWRRDNGSSTVIIDKRDRQVLAAYSGQ